MSDDHDIVEGPDGLPSQVVGALAHAATWDELPAELEHAVLAAIASEVRRGADASPSPAAPVAPVAPLATPAAPDAPIDLQRARDRRARRAAGSTAMPWWLAAAAAIAVVVTGVVLVTRSGPGSDAEFALAGTELAPDATASVEFDAAPAGLRIELDVAGLPGAGPDEVYEAWIGDGDIRVSAGTFHLRGGDGPISLWAGTADPRFHVMTITIEPLDGDATSSGQVVLRGEFEMPGG